MTIHERAKWAAMWHRSTDEYHWQIPPWSRWPFAVYLWAQEDGR